MLHTGPALDALALPLGEAEFARLDLPGRLAAVRAHISGRIVFTTSFGIEDQAIGHAIFMQGLPIDVVTLDTGRLFPETHAVWAETERRYGGASAAFYPDHRSLEQLVAAQGIDGFRDRWRRGRHAAACARSSRSRRALDGASAWITGLRADQSGARADTRYLTHDPVRI